MLSEKSKRGAFVTGRIFILQILYFIFSLSNSVDAQQDSVFDQGKLNDTVNYHLIEFDDSIRVYQEFYNQDTIEGLLPYYGFYSKSNTYIDRISDAGSFNENGNRHGLWYFKGPNGTTIFEEFVNGFPLGHYRELYPNGNLKRMGKLDTLVIDRNVFPIMVGRWVTFYSNGQLESIGLYRNNLSGFERKELLNMLQQTQAYSEPLKDLFGIKDKEWRYYNREGNLNRKVRH